MIINYYIFVLSFEYKLHTSSRASFKRHFSLLINILIILVDKMPNIRRNFFSMPVYNKITFGKEISYRLSYFNNVCSIYVLR